jgi:hypothetical protein
VCHPILHESHAFKQASMASMADDCGMCVAPGSQPGFAAMLECSGNARNLMCFHLAEDVSIRKTATESWRSAQYIGTLTRLLARRHRSVAAATRPKLLAYLPTEPHSRCRRTSPHATYKTALGPCPSGRGLTSGLARAFYLPYCSRRSTWSRLRPATDSPLSLHIDFNWYTA